MTNTIVDLAIISGFNTASGKYYCNKWFIYVHKADVYDVSIPQAVSTIAIGEWKKIILFKYGFSFNTASGKYYCNTNNFFIMNSFPPVSIPQAVSTIAIQSISLTNLAQMYQVSIPQAVSTIAI